MKKLVRGTRGWAVRWLQQALNKRARARGLPTITVDGVLGTETLMSVQRVGRALGALEATLAQAHPKRGDKAAVTIGLQRIIRWPATRNPAQLRRARDRKAAAERRRASGAAAAIAWATRWIGRTEDPPGSNRGSWGLTAWQTALGAWLVGQAWCGVFVGTALREAGVLGITSRVASVWFILEDALAGRNGFEKCVYRRLTGHGSVTAGQPGDAIGLFGESTHVELIEKRVPGGYQTIGGNTSPSDAGSQSNGGGVFRRVRPYAHVAYIARPRYQEN